MDSSAAINTAVSALSSGGTAAAIAVSVLRSTETAQAQQIATLFSSIGLGASINAFA
jgi:hypothetical protein